eukprot:snap_masked-scaffold_22-processed-gene-2.39-mRNA-1 protein AED:1.00 eAED:1.00 QI:0/0/0/0/1/1/2/0/60
MQININASSRTLTIPVDVTENSIEKTSKKNIIRYWWILEFAGKSVTEMCKLKAWAILRIR